MVAGDLVNTASRVQSAAAPGTVLVGEATTRAIGGGDRLRGRRDARAEGEGRARAAVARRPRRRAARRRRHDQPCLEPPFVGRDRELRLVKELFHASAEEGRAHLVSVVGVGGIGKSRLAWEFEKYLDGLGGGRLVAPRPLPRLRRGSRVLGARRDGAHCARASSRTRTPSPRRRSSAPPSTQYIPDPEERRFVEPRLAHLLGLEERGAPDQENLFAAWRLFFERMSEALPVILVFEDIHWADSALLDFVEYLVDWAQDHPIFILTLARPELADRRPTWGAGKRDLQLALPRSAPARRDGSSSHGPGPRPARRSAETHPRARRGSPVLRGRDRAHAARPRPDRARGRRVPTDREDRDARGAGDPPGADRRPTRRARPGGARPPAGRLGARQDVHGARARAR